MSKFVNARENARVARDILARSRAVAVVLGTDCAVNGTEISRPVSDTANARAHFNTQAKTVALRAKLADWERKHGRDFTEKDNLCVRLNGTTVALGRVKLHGSATAILRLRYHGRTILYREFVGKTNLH